MSLRLRYAAACLLLAGVLLGGCSVSAYLGQSIGGGLDVLRRAQPIDELLADAGTAPDLRARLVRVRNIRNFASESLLLPDNGSYRSYADLGRPFVVWNVFAAPELSLKLKDWCFPVTGCVGYRGYFSQAEANAFAADLRKQGYDVFEGGVPAYSTLGYFDDPVLNTFINYPEPEIARLLFHELAHQVAYASGDTMFNESFAVAVEREGMRRFLAGATPAAAASYQQTVRRREQFLQLVDQARRQLAIAYAEAGSDDDRRVAKARVIAGLKSDYDQLRNGAWAGFTGYDTWFGTDLNNAKLGSIAVYSARVPAFETLLQQRAGNLADFYADVRRLAKLPQAERDAALDKLGGTVEGSKTQAAASE